MAQTILGVDLGSYSLKVAVLERRFGDFQLKGFYEVPLFAEEVLSPAEAAGAAFHKFLQSYPESYDYSVAGFSAERASLRILELPFTSVKKIDSTVAFELESLIPLDIEDVIFDYCILEKKTNLSRVLGVYLREKDFGELVRTSSKGDLDPRYWGLDAVALSYLPNLGTLPPEGSFGVLDLGHQKTNFVLFEDGKLKLAKCFSWGGKELTRIFQEELQLEEEAARDYKHEKAVLKPDSTKAVDQKIYAAFERLNLKIKQCLFALSESGESSIEALYLCGGTSQITGVDAFFSDRLKLNVGFLEGIEKEIAGVKNLKHAQSISPTAVGLALQGTFPSKGNFINFRQGDYAYKRDLEALGGAFKRIGALAASVVLLGLTYYTVRYFHLSGQVEAANKNVAKLVQDSVKDFPKKHLKSTKSMLRILNARTGELKEKLKTFESGGSLSSLKALQLISQAMPAREKIKVDIDKVTLNPNQGRLEGKTENFESVAKVKSAMETVSFFKNVQKVKEVKGVRGEIKFTLSFDIVTEESEEG